MKLSRPAWLAIAQSIDSAVLETAEQALTRPHPDIDLGMIPYAAILHLRACMSTGLWANGQGYHAASLGILRQSIEALTIVDLGLQPAEYNSDLLKTHDPVKAARIYLLSALIVWTLARLLLANYPAWSAPSEQIDALGKSIAKSKLLDKGENWSEQLLGMVHFKPGFDWTDPPL